MKIESSKYAMSVFSNRVKYGPFEGMLISENVWWGRDDFPSKLVGQYEKHILDQIISNSKSYSIFIDIGAADGYYAVGLLAANIFKSACCFEISDNGRRVISENAELNNVIERISIKSAATGDELVDVIKEHGPALILCDIEGAEFTLFDDFLLSQMSHCMLIIELHDEYVANGVACLQNFIDISSKYFNLEYIPRSSPSVHDFKEFNNISDNQKMLMFSEGRPSLMRWIKLSPK